MQLISFYYKLFGHFGDDDGTSMQIYTIDILLKYIMYKLYIFDCILACINWKMTTQTDFYMNFCKVSLLKVL